MNWFAVQHNQLSGSVPASVGSVNVWGGFSPQDNMLSSTAADTDCIRTTFNSGEAWLDEQTLPPIVTSAKANSASGIDLLWEHAGSDADNGVYEAWVGETAGGPYTYYASISRAASGMELVGLEAGATCHIVVRAVRLPNDSNQNELISEWSNEVSATTLEPSGTVAIRKLVMPADDHTTFTFGGVISGQFGQGDYEESNVPLGTYTVTETVPEGWEMTGIACNEGATGYIEPGTAIHVVEEGGRLLELYLHQQQDPHANAYCNADSDDHSGIHSHTHRHGDDRGAACLPAAAAEDVGGGSRGSEPPVGTEAER
jgi:hypothetical protein